MREQAFMKTSVEGLEAIKAHEGVRTRAYLDTGGVWTIGIGHTGSDVYEGLEVDMHQVDAWLREDIVDAEDAVNRLVAVPLSQNQYDALVSFVFNLGEGQFSESTLLRKLNNGDYNGARQQFKRWVYDNGKLISGLVKRRYAEAELFGQA